MHRVVLATLVGLACVVMFASEASAKAPRRRGYVVTMRYEGTARSTTIGGAEGLVDGYGATTYVNAVGLSQYDVHWQFTGSFKLVRKNRSLVLGRRPKWTGARLSASYYANRHYNCDDPDKYVPTDVDFPDSCLEIDHPYSATSTGSLYTPWVNADLGGRPWVHDETRSRFELNLVSPDDLSAIRYADDKTPLPGASTSPNTSSSFHGWGTPVWQGNAAVCVKSTADTLYRIWRRFDEPKMTVQIGKTQTYHHKFGSVLYQTDLPPSGSCDGDNRGYKVVGKPASVEQFEHSTVAVTIRPATFG